MLMTQAKSSTLDARFRVSTTDNSRKLITESRMAATRKDTSDLPKVPVHVLIVDDDEPHAQAVAESLE
ncbi:MAG: hypothetical protein ACI93T_001677, partial [Porticoccaceae bacterium]